MKDIDGANDEPGQKDLTQFCAEVGDNAPYELHTLWNWDEVIISGGTTNDACSLYDSDTDGLANFAVCVTTSDGGEPAGLRQVRLFTCGDTRPDRCTSASQVSGNKCYVRNRCFDGAIYTNTCINNSDCSGTKTCEPAPDAGPIATSCSTAADCPAIGYTCEPAGALNTQCEVSQQNTDPFLAGSAYPADTEALCWVDLDDFGGGAASLIDACSYPSQSVNSDPSDCILTRSCSTNADCNDNNECTTDVCNTTINRCTFTPNTGASCDDGEFCTVGEVCSSLGFCNGGVPNTCDDEVFCTDDSCDEVNDQCDNDPRTDDDCDNGACIPEDDNNVCTEDTCDEVTGDQFHTPLPSTTVCRAGSGDLCDPDEFCTGIAEEDCPADVVASATTVCNPGSGDLCDPDESCTGVPGAACPADTIASATTICRPGSGDSCDPDESCSGVADEACPDDVVLDDGSLCDDDDPCTSSDGSEGGTDACDSGHCVGAPIECDDTANRCTDPDTCVEGFCQPNNLVCSAVTDSSLCEFDVSTKGTCADEVLMGVACDTVFPDECTNGVCTQSGVMCGTSADCCQLCDEENQFKLVFTPDGKLWPAYKLNASNPGQFFYNAIVGDMQLITIAVPYPFVTQGATPVHVYDADAVFNVLVNGQDCFDPPEGALAQSNVQITNQDWIDGGATNPGVTCDMVCGPDGTGVCTFDVDLTTIDVAGDLVYVNVHLDYGLKGPHLDVNRCDDELVDRYDRAGAQSFWGSFDALDNYDNDDVALTDCQDYTFSDTGSGQSDTVQNLNTFKRIKGTFGMCWHCGQGSTVELVRDGTGELVAATQVDEDGYYAIPYKHTGPRAWYKVNLPDYGMAHAVELRANGLAEVSFNVANGTSGDEVNGSPARRCGIGFELAFLLGGLTWLHRRRRTAGA